MDDAWAPMLETVWRVALGAASVAAEASPWLLAGLIASGLIGALLPESAVARWLGGAGVGPIVRAALIGTPLPLCSCGVVPAAVGLRRRGAGTGATVSFLVATPENGADSIALSYAMLGPYMTIVRPVAGLISAVSAGLAALLVASRWGVPVVAPADAAGGCCGGGAGDDDAGARASSCCGAGGSNASGGAGGSGGSGASGGSEGVGERVRQGMAHALVRLVDDLSGWLVLGVVIAGAFRALVPAGALAEWGSGPWAMLAMALVGVPMYVCATSFTPVAASLIAAGVSPGAALVLLLAGPATNIGTIGIVRRELGGAVAASYVATVVGAAIACGLAADWLAGALGIDPSVRAGEAEHIVPAWLSVVSLAAVGFLMIRPLRNGVFRAVGLIR